MGVLAYIHMHAAEANGMPNLFADKKEISAYIHIESNAATL